MANKIFVTEDGLKKLQGELQSLKDVKRVEIAQKLKEAISFWDLSENSEYEDARNEQSAVEMRIMDLEEQLKNILTVYHFQIMCHMINKIIYQIFI